MLQVRRCHLLFQNYDDRIVIQEGEVMMTMMILLYSHYAHKIRAFNTRTSAQHLLMLLL